MNVLGIVCACLGPLAVADAQLKVAMVVIGYAVSMCATNAMTTPIRALVGMLLKWLRCMDHAVCITISRLSHSYFHHWLSGDTVPYEQQQFANCMITMLCGISSVLVFAIGSVPWQYIPQVMPSGMYRSCIRLERTV